MLNSLNECYDLDSLFKLWMEEQANESDANWQKTKGNTKNIKKNFFVKDGILCKKRYECQDIKVLFISNEANDDDSCLERKGEHRYVSNRVDDFENYYNSGVDEWDGKMRERICSLYMYVTNNFNIEPREVALDFAFMNLNKRGGTKNIGDGSHIIKYCELYKEYIKREIELIGPDIIIWLGVTTYDAGIHTKYLGAYNDNGKIYLDINKNKVPILRLWHTSHYRGKKEPLMEFNHNKIVGKLAAQLREEMNRFGL